MNNTNRPTDNYDVTVYERPSVTVDLLLFTIDQDDLKVLLIKRGHWPDEEKWALPGGFVRFKESLDEAALRKLSDETGIKDVYLEQLYTFGDVNRDPRTRVITVAYYALTASKAINFQATDHSKEAKWFSVKKLPVLAFDHRKIIQYGIERLKSKIGYSSIAFGLMPKEFRLSELQKAYEIILGEELDKRNFRKQLFALDLVEPTGKKELEGAHRPAMLYRFKKREVIIFD